MIPIEQVREWFAEDLRVTCNLNSPGVVRALASVRREQFLGPGPWQFVGGDIRPRTTPSDDPRHVYHNVSIAIDPARNLYNGQPGLVASWIESLMLAPGHRVLHVGCGAGYFTALMAEIVGPTGEVIGVDVDPDLAARASANLASWPWARAVEGDGRSNLPSNLDAILVNAGATHVLDEWLDAVRDGGRLLVPLTSQLPGMPASIGKGFVVLLAQSGGDWSAKVASMVAIYSLVGARDSAMESKLGSAFMKGQIQVVTRLRRDPHEPAASCWLHGTTNCLSR
jgi:protein-L-isoaspartate(D-aspartate) O-methyltransferase